MHRRVDVLMPDLELGADVVCVSLWLVEVGTAVRVDDRLLEIVADGVTFDVPSSCAGRLVRKLVGEDDPLRPGDLLGTIEVEE